MEDKIVTIQYKVWASDEAEGAALSQAMGAFVDELGHLGKKVTATKLTEALSKWKDNLLVRQAILKHFS